jgi:hypothetical protein
MKTIANGPEGPSYIIEIRTFWAYLIGISAITGMLSVMLMMYFIAPEPAVHTMYHHVWDSGCYTITKPIKLEHEPIWDKSQHISKPEMLDGR